MKIIFYSLSVVMVVIWALSYFVYSTGQLVHTILLLAIVIGGLGMVKKS